MKQVVIIVGIITAMACNNSDHAGDSNAGDRKASDSVAGEIKDPAKKMTLPEKTAAAPPIAAVYSGTLPCEKCAILEVTLTLMSDSAYMEKSDYMGGRGVTGGTVKTDTGKWTMRGDTLRLKSKTTNETYLKSGAGLTLLDGKAIKVSKKAGSYILKQTN